MFFVFFGVIIGVMFRGNRWKSCTSPSPWGTFCAQFLPKAAFWEKVIGVIREGWIALCQVEIPGIIKILQDELRAPVRSGNKTKSKGEKSNHFNSEKTFLCSSNIIPSVFRYRYRRKLNILWIPPAFFSMFQVIFVALHFL